MVATASLVTVNSDTPTSLATGMTDVMLFSYAEIRIGGSTVTWDDGFPVPGGTVFPIPIGLAISEHIYGISHTDDVDVHVLKTSAL